MEQELTRELIDRALSGVHPSLGKITSINGLLAARVLKIANKKLSVAFSKEANMIYNQYIKDIQKSTGDFQKLIDFRVMNKCSKYFYEEYLLASLAISEYHSYMYGAHIIDTILGKEREDTDGSTEYDDDFI